MAGSVQIGLHVFNEAFRSDKMAFITKLHRRSLFVSYGSLGRGKKESADCALTFFSLFLFSLDYPEETDRLRREG